MVYRIRRLLTTSDIRNQDTYGFPHSVSYQHLALCSRIYDHVLLCLFIRLDGKKLKQEHDGDENLVRIAILGESNVI